MDGQTVFRKLQPYCINVAKYGNFENVKILDSCLNEILKTEKENASEWISCISDVKEYIAFPLVLILKKETFTLRQNLLEAVLQCLLKVLAVSINLEWKFFNDTFTLLFKHLSDYEDPAKLGSNSEECKTEALHCIQCLCRSLDYQFLNNFCSEGFKAQLGHAIFICLQIVEKEKNRSLKVTALETIETLGLKDHQNIFDESMKSALSTVFANFLPGISLGATRIATGEEIQGHKVTVAAINCWKYFVILVMRDNFLSSYDQDLGLSKTYCDLQRKLSLHSQKMLPGQTKKAKGSESLKSKFDIAPPDDIESDSVSSPKLKSVTIESEWIHATADRLDILVKSLSSLVTHSHWRVRVVLTECAEDILCNCSRSLKKSLLICIEILITLSNDTVLDVSQTSSEALKRYRKNLSSQDMEKLSEMIEERVFSLTSRLPTIIKTQDDKKILASLRLLHGCLEIIDSDGISQLVQTPIHLQRLLRSLNITLTYDTSDVDILLDRSVCEDPGELISVKPQLGQSFRYFQSRAIFESASGCCQLLGSHQNLMLVVDQCLDQAQESYKNQNEAFLILSLVMKGAMTNIESSNLELELKEKIVSSIFDVIFSQKLFEAPLSISHCKPETREEKSVNLLLPYNSGNSSVSLELTKRNIVLVSNLLLLTGYCARFLQEDFKVFMSKVVCSVLEKAGEQNALVSHSAAVALSDIATACKFPDISQMIEVSVPLFWFPLSQKLKNLPDYPSSPLVLKYALRCSRETVAPFVEELVDDVLDTLDSFHSDSAEPLLMVLLTFVETMNVREITEPQQQSQVVHDWKAEHVKNDSEISLYDFIRKLDEDEKLLESELKDNESEAIETDTIIGDSDNNGELQQNEEQDMEHISECDESKNAAPRHIQYVVQILEKCSYLLFVKNRRTQLIILQIINASSKILDPWENEKLPAYHKLWKALVLRLKDKDFVVLLKALETCTMMVNCSGTFLRKRCLQELLPSLLFLLQSQSSMSLNKTQKSGYYLTPAYKAQKHTLEHLPALIRGLELSTLDIIELVDVVFLYLDDRQPDCLVQLAVRILSVLKAINSDLVWLTLSYARGPFVIKPPAARLKPIAIKGKKVKNLHPTVWEIYEELS